MSALRASVIYPLVALTLAACSNDAPTKPTTFSGATRLAYVFAAQIHVIDPDGSHDTTVTDATHAVIWYAWDNANQRVAYLDHNDRALHILDRKTGADHTAPAVANTNFINWFEWSPDGSRLVVLDSGRIKALSAAGDNPVILASDVDWLGTPMWSPDGGSVVTSGFGPVFNNEIFILPAGGGVKRTIESPVAVARTRVSPNGKNVVYQGDYSIWVAPMNGGAPRNVLTSTCLLNCADGEVFLYPRWSPDGTKLAGVTGHSEIWIANADGSELHKFRVGGSLLLPYFPVPEWSPDGSVVAFLSGDNTSFDVYTMHPDGTGKTQVTHVGRPDLVRWVR